MRKSTMAASMPRLKILIMLVFLILLLQSSSCQAGRSPNEKKPGCLLNKIYIRKALQETTLDYDYGGPNSKHDPKKGKPGTGGKP